MYLGKFRNKVSRIARLIDINDTIQWRIGPDTMPNYDMAESRAFEFIVSHAEAVHFSHVRNRMSCSR